MKPSDLTIGVTTVAFSKNEILVNELQNLEYGKIKTNVGGNRFSRSELVDFLSDCQGAIVGLDKVDDSLLSDLPNLKIIAKYGVGLDNIDLNACEKHGVKVVHTQGVNKRSVSELALGSILSLLRNVYVTSNDLKNGRWNKNGGRQLSDKVVGIIGLGHIGKDLVELLQPFNCRILVNDIVDQTNYYKENGLYEVTKDVMYEQADVISIHTPLNESTSNLFDKKVFAMMKSNAILINTARGGIINLSDLKWALKSGEIAGASIDVYDSEPPSDIELISIPNLINTPHIGGNAYEAVLAMGRASIDNLKIGFEV